MKFYLGNLLIFFIGAMCIGTASSCWCTKEWNPTCGKNKDGKEVTYLNPCTMECDEAELVKTGECGPDACICTIILHRVCGIKDGKQTTYSNDCLMECDGAGLAHYGECEKEPCMCTKELRPICGKKDGKWKNYGNKCAMECDGAELEHEGHCGTLH